MISPRFCSIHTKGEQIDLERKTIRSLRNWMQSCEQFFAVAWDKIRSVAHVEVNRPERLLLCFQAKYTNKYSAQCNLVVVEVEPLWTHFCHLCYKMSSTNIYLFIYLRYKAIKKNVHSRLVEYICIQIHDNKMPIAYVN